MKSVVGLITDFGRQDSYVAEVHSRILATVPSAVIVDVTHDVPAYDRASAYVVAERCIREFPAKSAIVVVVDPGVGSFRQRLAAKCNERYVVGPDNGVLPLDLDRDEIVVINPGFLRIDSTVHTFDGREIFGPIGALLASGLVLGLVGNRAKRIEQSVVGGLAVWINEPNFLWTEGQIVSVDRFGNAVSNIMLPSGTSLADCEIIEPTGFGSTIRTTYSEVGIGEPLVLCGSSGRIEFAVRQGKSNLPLHTKIKVRCRKRTETTQTH